LNPSVRKISKNVSMNWLPRSRTSLGRRTIVLGGGGTGCGLLGWSTARSGSRVDSGVEDFSVGDVDEEQQVGTAQDLAPLEGQKLLGIVRRGSGSVVRWRRAQIVLWSAQAMDVPAIARTASTTASAHSPDENADDGTPMVGLLLANATRPLVVDEVDAGDRS
jgi:hypothetical protein